MEKDKSRTYFPAHHVLSPPTIVSICILLLFCTFNTSFQKHLFNLEWWSIKQKNLLVDILIFNHYMDCWWFVISSKSRINWNWNPVTADNFYWSCCVNSPSHDSHWWVGKTKPFGEGISLRWTALKQCLISDCIGVN